MNMLFLLVGCGMCAVVILLYIIEALNDVRARTPTSVRIFGGLIGMAMVAFSTKISTTPVLDFTFSESTVEQSDTVAVVDAVLVVGNDRIRLPSAEKRTVSTVPACTVSISLSYPMMNGMDKKTSVIITGNRCSEIDSILLSPQVQAVLSGWRLTDDIIIDVKGRF